MRNALLTFAMGLALGCTAALADPMVIKHAQGETALDAPPRKVLVLDVNALDIMDALGAEPAGVPGSHLPGYLSKYNSDSYLKAGTLFEPDYEAINAAEPDLVVVGGRSRAKFGELSEIAPTVDLTANTEPYTDGIKQNITLLGEIFGKKDRAAEMIATLDAKLDALKSSARKAGTALILVTNAGKVGAYGPGSRVGWLHKEVGFATVEEGIDDRFDGGDVVSFEYILEKDPDWLFVIDRDAGVGNAGHNARATLDNDLIARTRAAKNGHIVYLDPQAAYIASAGYTSVSKLIDEVQDAVSKQ
ncbi:siderophore ABC transporter substrate-binding protein (plasmid) [Aquamicrobium terrae]